MKNHRGQTCWESKADRMREEGVTEWGERHVCFGMMTAQRRAQPLAFFHRASILSLHLLIWLHPPTLSASPGFPLCPAISSPLSPVTFFFFYISCCCFLFFSSFLRLPSSSQFPISLCRILTFSGWLIQFSNELQDETALLKSGDFCVFIKLVGKRQFAAPILLYFAFVSQIQSTKTDFSYIL